jgi:hypothetical protein
MTTSSSVAVNITRLLLLPTLLLRLAILYYRVVHRTLNYIASLRRLKRRFIRLALIARITLDLIVSILHVVARKNALDRLVV